MRSKILDEEIGNYPSYIQTRHLTQGLESDLLESGH
jgi:hypothetical protein